MGALDDDIIEITDDKCDYKRLSDLFADLTEKAIVNWATQRKRTFFFIYYAGHAILDGTTKVVLNINKGYRSPYPLETMIRLLGKRKGVYVLGVLDCCRSPITA